MPPAPPPGRLAVTWFSSAPHAEIVEAVAGFAGLGPDDVRIVRACRSCGSDQHGKPHVVVPAVVRPLHLSLSRSGDQVVVAVTDIGPIGVDIETIRDEDLTAWVRTESLVKATGHGLTIDPAEIADERWTADLEAPAGFLGAVTILTTVPPDSFMTTRAAPGA